MPDNSALSYIVKKRMNCGEHEYHPVGYDAVESVEVH
jgi:hypothetical protein